MPTLIERIESNLLPEPNSGCWIWLGYVADGYGKINNKKGSTLVHRAMYEHVKGPVPEGLQLDHICRTRCCANPDHLEPVTQVVNVRRGAAARTHCKLGHPLDGYVSRGSSGQRFCKQCQRQKATDWARNNRPFPSSKLYCGKGHPLFGANMFLERKRPGQFGRRCKICRSQPAKTRS